MIEIVLKHFLGRHSFKVKMNEDDLDEMVMTAAALVAASPLAIEDQLDSRDKLIRIAAVIAARKLNKLENALLQEVRGWMV